MCKQSNLIKPVFLLPLEMCGPWIEMIRGKYPELGAGLLRVSACRLAPLPSAHPLERQGGLQKVLASATVNVCLWWPEGGDQANQVTGTCCVGRCVRSSSVCAGLRAAAVAAGSRARRVLRSGCRRVPKGCGQLSSSWKPWRPDTLLSIPLSERPSWE